MSEVEVDKICRTCLGLTGPLLSIYDGDVNSCIAKMLKDITKMKPKLQDNLPSKVCLACISEINRCFNFKMKCENSNRTLRQLIPNVAPEEQEPATKETPQLIHKSSQTILPPKAELKSVEVQTDKADTTANPPSLLEATPRILKDVAIAPAYREDTKPVVINEASCDNAFTYEESSNSDSETLNHSAPTATKILTDAGVHTRLKSTADGYNNYAIECVDEGSEYVVEVKHVANVRDTATVELDNVLVTPKNQPPNNGAAVYEIKQANKREVNDYEAESFTAANIEAASSADVEQTTSKNSNEKIVNVFYDVKRKRNEYKCSECPQTFISLNVLRRHLTKFHQLYVSDEIADKTEENNEEPTNLSEQSAPQNEYFCSQCKASFTTKRSMDIHLKKNICYLKTHKCLTCERIFETVEQLEFHANEHKSNECVDCNQFFETQELLTEHQVTKHKRKLQHQCNVCKKVFTMASTLKDHLRIHTGDKPFQCPFCSKNFSQKSNLKQHMQRHVKDKNFVCTEPGCPDSFVTRSELFSHQRKHTGAQPFKCDFCPAAFSTNSTLSKHRRSHTGERPYGCDICPMRFAALNVLKNHRRLHTGEKPFECPVCKKKFTQQGDFTIHLKTHDDAKCHYCLCGKQYPIPSRLIKHQKTCKFIKTEIDIDEEGADDQVQKSSDELIELNLAKMCND